MYNKKLAKIYAGCALSMVLAMAATPINALAADITDPPAAPAKTEVNILTPGTNQTEKDAKAAEAKTREKLDPTAEDDTTTTDTNEAYTDTDIDVWGYTEDRTVYSVDVEWGAMTFQYEASTWDPDTLTSIEGRGWQVYDNVNDKVLLGTDDATDVQDAINRITVTNHSNAPVKATLTYTGEETYGVTSGKFTAIDTTKQTENEKTGDNPVENFNAEVTITAGTDSAADTGVITLQTADNKQGGDGAKGKATVGNVYFMPSSIKKDGGTPASIDQWSKIGKITVSLATVPPAETPETPTPDAP